MLKIGTWNTPASNTAAVGSSKRRKRTDKIHTASAAGTVSNSGKRLKNDLIVANKASK